MGSVIGLLVFASLVGVAAAYQLTRLNRQLAKTGWRPLGNNRLTQLRGERDVVLDQGAGRSGGKPCWVVSTELASSPLKAGERLTLLRTHFPHSAAQVAVTAVKLKKVKLPPSLRDAFTARSTTPDEAEEIVGEDDVIEALHQVARSKPTVGEIDILGRALTVRARRPRALIDDLDGVLRQLTRLAEELEGFEEPLVEVVGVSTEEAMAHQAE